MKKPQVFSELAAILTMRILVKRDKFGNFREIFQKNMIAASATWNLNQIFSETKNSEIRAIQRGENVFLIANKNHRIVAEMKIFGEEISAGKLKRPQVKFFAKNRSELKNQKIAREVAKISQLPKRNRDKRRRKDGEKF